MRLIGGLNKNRIVSKKVETQEEECKGQGPRYWYATKRRAFLLIAIGCVSDSVSRKTLLPDHPMMLLLSGCLSSFSVEWYAYKDLDKK